ncbi:MAG: hypothetical protein WD696_09925 [Bryobacteraceae bacterium]
MSFPHLDTLLAFAVVMLGVSLLVTILTQMFSALANARGANLVWGVRTLMAALDPRLATKADELTRQVLTHPIISHSAFSGFARVPLIGWLVERWQPASAIRLEELIAILHEVPHPAAMAAAAGAGSGGTTVAPLASPPPSAATLGEALETGLRTWFSSTMDRVSRRFALHMRLWTVAFSILLAFAAHLDCFRLLSQLSGNAELRGRLAASTDLMLSSATRTLGEASPETARLAKEVETVRGILEQSGLQLLPSPYKWGYESQEIPGILVTAMLLSLGAPFWFNALKTFTNLRPGTGTRER